MQHRSRRAAALATCAAVLSLALSACNFGDGDSKPNSDRTSVAGPQPHRSTGVIEVFPEKGTRLNVVRYTVREDANPQGRSVAYRCGTAYSPVEVDSDRSTKYHGVTIKFQSKDNPTPNTTSGVDINQQSITLSITGSPSALKAFKAPMMIIRSLTAYPHNHKRMVFMPNQRVVDVHAVQLPAILKLTTSNFVHVLPAGSDSYISHVTLCAKRTTLNV